MNGTISWAWNSATRMALATIAVLSVVELWRFDHWYVPVLLFAGPMLLGMAYYLIGMVWIDLWFARKRREIDEVGANDRKTEGDAPQGVSNETGHDPTDR